MTTPVDSKRSYRQVARARAAMETRRQVVEAAVELHATVGPAGTTYAAVARRAGVQRLTVHRHFPTREALVAACRDHWATAVGLPDPSCWRDEERPWRRLLLALEELYRFYERGEPVLTRVVRDAGRVPELARALGPVEAALAALSAELGHGFPTGERVRAALALAVDFGAWRVLHAQGLDSAAAAAVMAGAVNASASRAALTRV